MIVSAANFAMHINYGKCPFICLVIGNILHNLVTK